MIATALYGKLMRISLGRFIFLISLIVFVLSIAGITRARRAKSNPHSESGSADVIISNARIYTGNRHQPWAQAVAIKGERIIAVGAGSDMNQYHGAGTRMIDAQQQLLLSGFTDSHIHFLEGGLSLNRVNLEGAQNAAEMQKRVLEFSKSHPPTANSSW